LRRAALLIMALAAASGIAACDSGKKSGDSGAKQGTSTSSTSTAEQVTAPAGIAEPRKVYSSGELGARAVENVYGKEVAPGQPVVIGSQCTNGDCIIRYRSQARGEGRVVEDQDRILRPLFARRSVRSVKLYVHHWQTGTPTKNEAPAFAITTCRRSEHPGFDWAHIGADDVTRVCTYVHEAGGKLRSEVRRGGVSNNQASQGKGGGGNGGGNGN
jgi:hypothetical protein